MNRRNYQRELETVIKENESKSRVPRLLLHSCCAPCSSYVLEYLSDYFEITVFYYNPNISPAEEYEKRAAEQKHLIQELPAKHPIHLVVGAYEPERFYAVSRGLEMVPEGGERCFQCFRLRLEEAAKMAAEGGFDYFATTLTISPLKNAQKLNEIGEELSEIYKVEHLPSDFKKKNGYKRSVELSAQYGLYRQNYCGCVFSKREAEERLHNSQKEDRQILEES
ncbi:epoxyqueuosine reductase QueH [Ventrimonas sp. CLA-AP-H27]|uniref:Epoxyqueuosine reductase QueH n=1 Tax=Ventrimonas faecis TaxID=3133170 RepID=A0ABV1HLC6_9FIRM